jgi:hypothetical protein
MTKSNENLTKERRTFKEFMDDNKDLFIIGGSLALAALGGTYLIQHHKFDRLVVDTFKKQSKLNELQNEINDCVTMGFDKTTKELKLVKAIAVEGALEEAIKSVKNKIQYRVTKIDNCIADGTPQALLSKEIYEKELEYFKDKLALFEEEWNKMIH